MTDVADKISNGLQALTTCCEMVFFAIAVRCSHFTPLSYQMLFTFSSETYRQGGAGRTSIWRSLFHALNFTDFIVSFWLAIRFGIGYLRGKPGTHSRDEKHQSQFGMGDIQHAANGDASQPMIERKGDGLTTTEPTAAPPMHADGRAREAPLEYARPPAHGQV